MSGDERLISEQNFDDATLTIRVVRSFEYRTIRNMVLHHIDLESETVAELEKKIREKLASDGGFRPFRTLDLDSLKIYTHAHFTKTINLAINLDNDYDWWLQDPSRSLASYGIRNETEITMFNREAYLKYKSNPQELW